MPKLLLLIGIGGFFGSTARYLSQLAVSKFFPGSFPVAGTFLVNIIGCLIIGMIYGLGEKENIMNLEWRLFLTIGFCGSFTTFSTFSFENLNFLQQGQLFQMFIYTGVSVIIGLLATYIGILMIRGI